MRIKKILIQNFKGIHEPHIVDLEKPLAVLRGPNGFGKTTIFDAIELSLTGELHRAMQMKRVTNDTKDYYDVPYRNTRNEDVVIKLHIARDDGEEKVIIKRLPYNEPLVTESREIKNKPADWKNVRTYIVPVEEFDQEYYELLDEQTQEDLERWFFNDNPKSLKRLYRLFGYLQQEENTFYLKLSEKDRKDELDHLFDTNKEASIVTKLGSRLSILGNIERQLSKSLKLLNTKAPLNDKVDYEKLIPKMKLDFDEENPFLNTELEDIDTRFATFKSNLQDVEIFINSFDVTEYNKHLSKQRILKLSEDSRFLQYAVVNKLLEDNTYNGIVKQLNLQNVSRKDSFLKYFIVQNFFTADALNKLSVKTEHYTLFNNYLNDEYKPVSVEEKISELSTWENGLSASERESISGYRESLQKSKQGLTQIEDTVSELKEFRTGLKSAYEKAHKLKPEDEGEKCECPLCGFGWDSYQDLQKSIEQKTTYFDSFKSDQVKILDKLKEEIETKFLLPLEKRFETYTKENKNDFNFYNFLKKTRVSLGDLNYANYSKELLLILPQAKSLIWSSQNTAEQLSQDILTLSKLVSEHISLDEAVIRLLGELRGYSYEKALKELTDLKITDPPTWSKLGSSQKLESDVTKLRQSLIDKASGIKVDVQKIGGNLQHLYKMYFFEDNASVIRARQFIKQKSSYIDWQYHQKKYASFEVLRKRHEKLILLIGRIEQTKKSYESILKVYKASLINSIRVPFYIYSAKIMQNYQQGIGVFLAPSDGSSGAIRFLTEAESDHDVVHHLSSGQLAVVSIAFTLAINKVYGSSSLHFLAVDDPVHELDILNVHSFVEVLRHDFIDQYQLIVSSHDQDSAMYMQYKFEKFMPEQVIPVNVQKLFFKVNE